jgi:hypothetical protein
MKTRILIAALGLTGALAFAATNPQPGVEVQMILTSADHMNHHPPVLKPADVTIMDGTITDWLPLTGRDLELFVLIDDSANYDLDAKLQEIRQFITIQPDPVSIGIAYIHEGVLQVVQNPTTDHRLAARALRAPSGSKAANPYYALSDLIANWPKRTARREIVIVTSGVDDSAGGSPVCDNAETAIHDAERAGVMVYALYTPPDNYLLADWSKLDAGQVSLASLSYETGGEAYFVGHVPPLSFEPFLTDIEEHFAHQYLVSLRLTPASESAFQTIFITSANPDRELMKPEKIWVPTAAIK